MSENSRVYLDWAAATPLSDAAFLAMQPYFSADFGNAGAIHKEGIVAKKAVETAREQVAKAVQVKPEFVTFTGGGTEGNNLAILGAVEAVVLRGKTYSDIEVVTTKIEHPSVMKVMNKLSGLGVGVKFVEVKEDGRVDLESLRNTLSPKTVLFSVAYANSEIGTIQPLHAISKILKTGEENYGSKIFFHVDAAQAPLWLNCQFDSTQADLLTLDFAKCCGPKGVGALVRSRRVEVLPNVFGGGQEAGLRPGTENVPGIVGASVAMSEAQAGWKERVERVSKVRDEAIEVLCKEVPELFLNGASGENRLANNINISIPGLDTEFAAVVLDSKGFAVSTKSACAGAGGGESVVVKEISSDPARASSTLRFSLGPDTKIEDLKKLAEALKQHLEKMKGV